MQFFSSMPLSRILACLDGEAAEVIGNMMSSDLRKDELSYKGRA
jgi:hypothetical protein